MPRLLTDENIPTALSKALRDAGHDVLSVFDLSLQGSSDDDVLKAATQQTRILITADKDFGFILESGPLAGRGRVILLRYQTLDWTLMGAELNATLDATGAEFSSSPSLLVVLSEGQYRIRRWTAAPERE